MGPQNWVVEQIFSPLDMHLPVWISVGYSLHSGTNTCFPVPHHFLCLGLYVDPVWHSSTLTPTSFAETFCLRGEDLVACIQVNRGCTGMFCEQLGGIEVPGSSHSKAKATAPQSRLCYLGMCIVEDLLWDFADGPLKGLGLFILYSADIWCVYVWYSLRTGCTEKGLIF